MSVAPILWATRRARRIAAYLEVSWDDFCGKGRHLEVIRARQIVAYLLRTRKGPGNQMISFPEIAASTGAGNHSTIVTRVRRVEGNEDLQHEANAVALALNDFQDEKAEVKALLPPPRWNTHTAA